MKGLKKIALITAIAAAPFAAQAELQVMDDSALSAATGQAGLSIDLTADVTIGEIAYQDEGFIAIADVAFGIDGTTVTIDVAADGDLIIAVSETGYSMSVGSVSLQKEAYLAALGTADATSNTVLLSNLNLSGTIGSVDVVIDEDTSVMNVDATFNATGDFDVPFLNVSVDGFQMGNMRIAGVTSGDVGYAHANADIYKSAKGLKIDVNDFSADIDMAAINIGGTSIGGLFITDLAVTASLDVYGH